MQWKVVVAFLIGTVLGALGVYLYLQLDGQLMTHQRVSTPAPALPSQPAGVAPPVAGVRAKPAVTSTILEPKPEVEPEVTTVSATPMAIPVAGVEKSSLRDHFNDKRGGARRHEAIDIMAPRGTPVLAAVDGKIARLFSSAPGGITIYQTDSLEQRIFYYAHLDRYAADLKEGKAIRRGDVIGYVGSTGNAVETAPHLHFAIMRTQNPREWWKGDPINPYPLLLKDGITYRQ